jgi:glycosyltransferase involved in cell wall biosynthesis
MKPHQSSGRTVAEYSQKTMDAMDASPIVEVLLATYNGERFVCEQIDSILAQDYKNLRVLARDDGSSDGTPVILREYERRFPDRFRAMQTSTPTGSAKENFVKLMKASASEYVCFCDQDDIWLPDKVSRSMQAMAMLESRYGTTSPLLVFTDLRVVDDALKTIHESLWEQAGVKPERITNLAAVLGHNIVTGCTALVNRRLLDMAVHMPEEAAMHDSWIALLASAFGASEIVREKTVLYRQHDRNVVGVDTRKKSTRELIVRFLQGEGRILQWKTNERVAEAMLRVHGKDLSPKQRELLEAYLCCGRSDSRIVRVGTMLRYRFFRPGLLRNLATLIDLWRRKMGQAVN